MSFACKLLNLNFNIFKLDPRLLKIASHCIKTRQFTICYLFVNRVSGNIGAVLPGKLGAGYRGRSNKSFGYLVHHFFYSIVSIDLIKSIIVKFTGEIYLVISIPSGISWPLTCFIV